MTRFFRYVRFPDAPAALSVVVASTPVDRAKGLANVRALARNWGLLLEYPERADHSLWMRDVIVPLDMIFVDDWSASEGRIMGIVHEAQPGDERHHKIGVPSRYVIEAAGGWCRLWGVVPGQRVELTALELADDGAEVSVR